MVHVVACNSGYFFRDQVKAAFGMEFTPGEQSSSIAVARCGGRARGRGVHVLVSAVMGSEEMSEFSK